MASGAVTVMVAATATAATGTVTAVVLATSCGGGDGCNGGDLVPRGLVYKGGSVSSWEGPRKGGSWQTSADNGTRGREKARPNTLSPRKPDLYQAWKDDAARDVEGARGPTDAPNLRIDRRLHHGTHPTRHQHQRTGKIGQERETRQNGKRVSSSR